MKRSFLLMASFLGLILLIGLTPVSADPPESLGPPGGNPGLSWGPEDLTPTSPDQPNKGCQQAGRCMEEGKCHVQGDPNDKGSHFKVVETFPHDDCVAPPPGMASPGCRKIAKRRCAHIAITNELCQLSVNPIFDFRHDVFVKNSCQPTTVVPDLP